MESDPPRPVVPSRYKTVRRKPTTAANASAAAPSPAVAVAAASPSKNIQNPPADHASTRNIRQKPLVDLAASPSQSPSPSPHVSQQPQPQASSRGRSALRKILHLNTFTRDHTQVAAPAADGPKDPPAAQSASQSGRHVNRPAPVPPRAQTSSGSEEEEAKKQARDESLAALEGRSRKSSRAAARPLAETVRPSRTETRRNWTPAQHPGC